MLEAQIREWVELYGIKDRTDIHIKPNNVSELERNADIYISTSLFEGTSNSIMEALNWSLPVVATNEQSESSRELFYGDFRETIFGFDRGKIIDENSIHRCT